MNTIWEFIYGLVGYPSVAQEHEIFKNIDIENLENSWYYVESEVEQRISEMLSEEQLGLQKEIQEMQSKNTLTSREYWTHFFDSYLVSHENASDPAFQFDLPRDMRTSIMQKFIRSKKAVWVNVLKNFAKDHEVKEDDTDWENFATSFLRIPTLNNKGKEGAIIDFALLAYEGVLTGKSLARILWAWSKTLASFLDTDFRLHLTTEEMSGLEQTLSLSVLDLIDLHVTACITSCHATQKLGLLPEKWEREKKVITKIDARYESPTKICVQENEKPTESMVVMQDHLMQSLFKPLKRQVPEIPEHEKMLRTVFSDARSRLEKNLATVHWHDISI
jgi:hypothetical protein